MCLVLHEKTDVQWQNANFCAFEKPAMPHLSLNHYVHIVLSIDILLAAYTSKFIETVKVLVLCLMICGICCASHVIGFVTWAGCLLEMAWSNLLTISGVIDSICKNACHTTWSKFMLVVNRMISSKRWYGKYWCDASRSTANISTIDCDHKYWKWSVFILTLSPSISYVSFSSAIKSKLRQTVKKGLQTQTQQQKHRDQFENVWRKLHSLCLPIHGTRAQEASTKHNKGEMSIKWIVFIIVQSYQ